MTAMTAMDPDDNTTSYAANANADADAALQTLLERREQLSNALNDSPYDLILYLRRAVVYSNLGYPDLAAGDAYRALLLTDEVRNDGFEYHEQAARCLRSYGSDHGALPDVLNYGALSSTTSSGSKGTTTTTSDVANTGHGNQDPESHLQQLADLASTRCYQILSISLLLCGCLKSAYTFCERGLAAAPTNQDLADTKANILNMVHQRLRTNDVDVSQLPDRGVVRREVYPWNSHEPDRFSEESLAFLNSQLASMAPKCAVRVSDLPVLLDAASSTDSYDIIPTCRQLGLFATADIAPGETVLDEYTMLTANNRHKESVCDACGAELPPLVQASPAVKCAECHDTIFCDDFCHARAQASYHPAVCDKEVDSIAKDPDAREADESLYLLLLARLLAMAAHQDVHPLELKEIKYIWGDFLPTRTNAIDLRPNAGPPPDWTLPFSFRFNIETPLHILEKMDIDVFATLARHDLWVLNTCYAKFRGTASARKSARDGRPDVAGVHPFWCLANHDCNPNVTWEWGGRMRLWARETRVVGSRSGGIKAGEEVLNHYCDVTLPVQQRREWARGSLGGWCMCQRCRDESAANAASGDTIMT